MRKSSPGKTLFSSANVLQSSLDKGSTSPIRTLDFNPQAMPQTPQSLNQTSNSSAPVQSWADRVRGTSSSVNNAVKTTEARTGQDSSLSSKSLPGHIDGCVFQDVNDDGDDEGWETVHRGRKTHSSNTRKCNRAPSEKASNGRTDVKLNLNHLETTKVMNGITSNGALDNQGSHTKKDANDEAYSSSVKAENLAENFKDKVIDTSPDDEEQASLSDIEHEKALSAATEQEESLSRQIEECQNQIITSVIEHEESLTKEIAEEEELVTQINGENESQVIDIDEKEDLDNGSEVYDHSLNCSGTTNGDSVSAPFYLLYISLHSNYCFHVVLKQKTRNYSQRLRENWRE